MVTGRQVLWAVGFAAFGAAVALGVNAVAESDHAGGPASAPTGVSTPLEIPSPVPPDPVENPEAAELFDIVTNFQTLEIHASYRISVSARPSQASVIEVWQKDGQFRQEAEVQTPSGELGTLLFLSLTDRTVSCTQPPDGDWVCGLVPESQASAFTGLRSGLLTGLADQDVSARDDVIDGREVRCFVVDPGEAGTEPDSATQEPGEVCATPEGVLVLITSGEGTFELLQLETVVDDAVFIPPATPGVGPGEDPPEGPPAPA